MNKANMLFALGILAGGAAMAAPATPVVTASSGAIKRLDFDWEIIPKSNYYELWFQSNPAAASTKFAESVPWRPHASNNISAHLLDWQNARYRVKACNPSGCSETAPISVENLFNDSLGYFKSSPSRTGAHFGVVTALSEDGRTLAVVADNEPGSSTDPGSVSVYVFAKSGSSWRQQARLRPASPNGDNSEAPSISLSKDGNVLALGLLGSNQEGQAGTTDTGQVFMFRRNGTTWAADQTIARPETASFFGYIVKLDEAGSTLVAVDAGSGGTASIYRRVNGAWALARTAHGPGSGINCEALTLSGDGHTITRACRWPNGSEFRLQFFSAESGAATGEWPLTGYLAGTQFTNIATSFDASVIIASVSAYGLDRTQLPNVTVVDRNRGHSDTLVPDWGCLDQWTSAYGTHIAISHDAKVIAVSDPADKCTEKGSQAYPGTKGATAQGAVYIYGAHSSGTWPRRRVLHRNGNLALPPDSWFGGALALADNGRTLAISQVDDRSGANGVDGNRDSTSKPASGAVWLY